MKLSIGTITYNEHTAKYLRYFLDSLKNQTFKDFELFVFDNSDSDNNPNTKILEENGIKPARAGKNIGFAKAYNIMIEKALNNKSEYFLAINPDTIIEPDAIRKMVDTMDKIPALGSASPKVKVWDFENKKKTDTIDTCGIAGISALRFKDLGQGEEDKGQYDNAAIIGPSGAAAMYRISALGKAKDQFGYFDDRMFMYEEDCDLAYRLKKAGFSSKLVPESVIYHDRTAKSGGTGNLKVALNRKNKSRQVKAWAFRNKHLIFLKHWQGLKIGEKLEVIWFAFRMFIYALFFERCLLKEYGTICQMEKSKNGK